MNAKSSLVLKVISFNEILLKIFYIFFKKLFKKYGFKLSLVFLKKKKKKITFLKSAHVHKKAREQFQMTKFSYLISFFIPEPKIFEFFSVVTLNIPKNIHLNLTIKSKNKYSLKDYKGENYL